MESQLSTTWQSFADDVYSGWILWNSFLALIPLVLSYWLFRRKKPIRTFTWWAMFMVFVVFLPNAPYMLTDVIHLIRGAQRGVPIWAIALIFIPLHLFAMLGGFLTYMLSLINLDIYIKRQGLGMYIPGVELTFHALSSVGIYLGRFRRFNSWDLVTVPQNVLIQTLDDLTSRRPLLVMFVCFIILTVLYWLMKQIVLGLMLRIRYARSGIDVLK